MNILVFVAYAFNNPHFDTELEIIQNHLDQGDQVTMLACNGDLLSCDINFQHTINRCMDCISRRVQGLELLSENITIKKIYFLTQENQKEIQEFEKLSFSSLDQLKTLKIDNFDIGYAILSSLVSGTRNPEPDIEMYKDIILRMGISSLAIYRSIQNYLSILNFDQVYVYNGRYSVMRAVFRACQSKNVDCFLHERGSTLQKYSLYKNVLPHDIDYVVAQIKQLWENSSNTVDRNFIGEKFFLDNNNNISSSWFSFTVQQQKDLLPDNWDSNKLNLVIFNSSDDEYVAIGDIWNNPIYLNQIEGITKIIESLQSDPHIHIYIRIHPNLKNIQNKYTQLLNNLKSPNLTIIPADSPISSYELLRASSKVLTFGSTMGIEAVYWEKPSILAGQSLYRKLGATYNPKNHQELINLIYSDLPPKDKKPALMYGYYMQTFGKEFKYYKASGIYKGTFKGVEILPKPFNLIQNIGLTTSKQDFIKNESTDSQTELDFTFINKRILVINNIYPPQELGGYGRYISDFANILREKGHQVKVLTSDAPYLKEITEVEPNVDRNLILYGDYKQLPPTVIKDQKELNQILLKNHQYIVKTIREFQPDVALIGNIDFLGANIFEPFFEQNIPVINHLAFNQPGYSLEEKPHHNLYHLSTCSRHVKDNTLNLGYDFDDISVIYPGAYVDNFKQERLPTFDKLKIVFASIVSQYKGPQTLIEALAILHHEGFDFDCILAGTAPVPEFKDSLEKFIKSHGMENKIKLIGYQSRETLIKLYQERNIFVFPSVWDEPFGISQVEGMAAGLTTITSATGGASEIVEHGISGLKFQRNNPLSLAFCFLRLLANKEDWTKISEQGIKRAKEAFDIYHSVDLLEAKFAELLLKRDNYDQWLKLKQKDNIVETNITLTQINYLIFPDWQSDEEALSIELTQLIYQLANNSPLSKGGEGIIPLVIDTTGITEEDANLFLSGIAMNLMMEEELDLENTLDFALINNLNEKEWNNLLPKITAKITLENENQEAINQLNLEDLVTIEGNGNNYAIFPDWKADQEELALEIAQVLMNLSEEENCTLLVNLNDVDREEVGLFFSEIAMNLMLTDGIELSENLQINFVNFTANQWQSLGELIKEKITMNHEDLSENLLVYG